MQPYYGDEPHIIQKRPKKRRVYGKKRRGTLQIFLIFAFCAILPIAAVCAFMPKIAQPTTKTYRSKAYAVYFLITGSYDAIADANLASDVVRERGGAGYIINDGSFKKDRRSRRRKAENRRDRLRTDRKGSSARQRQGRCKKTYDRAERLRFGVYRHHRRDRGLRNGKCHRKRVVARRDQRRERIEGRGKRNIRHRSLVADNRIS